MHDHIDIGENANTEGPSHACLVGASRQLMAASVAPGPDAFASALAECFSQFPGLSRIRVFVVDPQKPAVFNLRATCPTSASLDGTLSLEAVAGYAALAREARRQFAPIVITNVEPEAAPDAVAVVLHSPGGRPKGLVLADCLETAARPGFADALDHLSDLAQSAFEAWSAVQQLRGREEQLAERLSQVTDACGLANAELVRAARLSDQFLANMSHELRTPLNTVLGMAQALQEGVMGPVNDDQTSYLQMIEKAGRQLLSMLTDILTLSKAGAGRLDVHPEMVAIQSLCQDCFHFIVQPARQKHLRLEMKCDPQANLIEADENFLKQVLVNLLTNAVKFTDERGTLNLEVIGQPEDHAVAFVVKDTGIGIEPEKLDRLFQPFVQMQSGGLARQYPGTGLGLSLVYRLTDLHGGSVEASSTFGQGSTFTVRFPWTPPDPPAAPPAAGGAKGQLLLVDDNEHTIKTTQALLAAAGHQVMVARQGAEALERAAEGRPDLVLVDLQLSGMNGWALMKHMQANPRLRDIGIIALTSQVLPGERERCLAEGADAWLVRPVGPTRLLDAVAASLARRGRNGTAPATAAK
jgi:signal transduction histidine kinase/ActR/RegA family two-component response regulator